MLALAAVLTAASFGSKGEVLAPPMGWNSWDCFQGNLNETGATAVAEAMVRLLAPAGYDILTIDEFWYKGDCAKGSGCLDANGRPQPDVAKWPSSAGGKGFKPFADKMHAMGLKVGIHTLRGSVSSEAIANKSPILGTKHTVDEIATTKCSWNSNWFAINMSHPASQPWLDSVYGQYADWGIDLIKNDCIFAFNMAEDNIKGVSRAIAKTGHPTVYSLSPGGANDLEVTQAKSIASDVNIYRVTNDWHGGNLDRHFEIAAAMQAAGLIDAPGLNGKSFPDLDMLNPYKNAKNDTQFQAQMTLWSIARSPLIYGADIRSASLTTDDFALMLNPEVLNITKSSTKNLPIKLAADAGFIAWTAESADGLTNFVAFVTATSNPAATASVTLAQLGIKGSQCAMRDLWARKPVADAKGAVAVTFPAPPGAKNTYQSALFALSGCK